MGKIALPKRVTFAPGISKSKVRYLEHGFRMIGVDVVYNDSYVNQIWDDVVYPFRLDYKGGRSVVCWLDIVASRTKTYTSLLNEHEETMMFKTHLAKTDLKKHPRLLPMPQCTSNMRYFSHLGALRENTKRRPHKYDIVGIFVNSDAGLRTKAVDLIRQHEEWKGLAWMIIHPRLPRAKIDVRLQGPKMNYYKHLDCQSRSKICLAMPGARKNQGASISFRHVEAWGMGAFVLTMQPGTVLVGNPKQVEAHFKVDLSDFAKKVNFYINNEDARKEVQENGRRYFDSFLTPQAHAWHVLKNTQEVI